MPAEVLSPSVTLHQLLAGVQTGQLIYVSYALEVGLVAWYASCVLRLRGKGRSWSSFRTASFVAGVATTWVATGSGLASYDESNFTMHVVQHLILMNVAPILLGLGAPITLALQASKRSLQSSIIKVLRGRVVSSITFPVVTAFINYTTMVVYFLTPVYAISERHPLFHDYVHLHFLVAGCLYWWVVIGLDHSRWRLSYPAKLGYLATGVPINAILGVSPVGARKSIDAALNTLADTHAGGAVLWGVGELVLVAALGVMFIQWSRADRREAYRMDRRLERELAGRGDALAGGVIGTRAPDPPVG